MYEIGLSVMDKIGESFRAVRLSCPILYLTGICNLNNKISKEKMKIFHVLYDFLLLTSDPPLSLLFSIRIYFFCVTRART
jgi:hypothetical protein